MTRLRLFGSIHYNTLEIVEDDLREFAEGADAIAIEDPRLGTTVREIVTNVARFPLLFIAWQLFFLVMLPLLLWFTRDIAYSTEQRAAIEVADDRPVHSVDRHPIAVLAERRPYWSLVDWLVFVGMIAVSPVAAGILIGLAVGVLFVGLVRYRIGLRHLCVGASTVLALLGLWGVIFGPIGAVVLLPAVVGMFASLVFTIDNRDEIMLEDVAALAEEHGYDDICLTTGYAHLPGMVENAEAFGLTVTDTFKQRWRESGERLAVEDVSEEISTPTVQFDAVTPRMETAGSVFSRRIGATILDGFGILVAIAMVAIGGSILGLGGRIEATTGQIAGYDPALLSIVATPIVVAIAYYAGFEAGYGYTPGKWVAGLIVVRTDGTPCRPREAVLRALCLPIDAGPIGLVTASVTSSGRRVGDRLAGTTVVRTAESIDAEPSRSAVDTAGSGRLVTSRALAIGVDWLCLMVLILLTWLLALLGWEAIGSDLANSPWGTVVLLIGTVSIVALYYTAFESLTGQTIGKWRFGTRVVSRDGTPCTLGQAAVRTLCRPIDALLVGPLLAALSADGRRLGDRLAGTIVVRTAPSGSSESTAEQTAESTVEEASETTTVRREPAMDTVGSVLSRRAGATIVDWLVIAVLALGSSMVLVGVGDAIGVGSDVVLGLGALVLWFGTPPAYFVGCEWRYGETVGKRLLGLMVVRRDGSPCTFSDAVIRTLVHPIDFLPLGYAFGVFLAKLSASGQRLGDRIAGTVVVRVETIDDSPVEEPDAEAVTRSEPLPSVAPVEPTARAPTVSSAASAIEIPDGTACRATETFSTFEFDITDLPDTPDRGRHADRSRVDPAVPISDDSV